MVLGTVEAQTCGNACTKIGVLGVKLADYQRGLFHAFQVNPDDSTDQCAVKTEISALAIIDLFDFNSYSQAGNFDFFEGFDKYQILTIQLINTMDDCGFKTYYTKIDEMFSSWDILAGAGLNVLVDIIVGFVDNSNPRGTPIIKAWDTYIIPSFANGFNDADWIMFGQGWEQFLAALVKFQGPTHISDEVETT
jgi:hypothetical protein